MESNFMPASLLEIATGQSTLLQTTVIGRRLGKKAIQVLVYTALTAAVFIAAEAHAGIERASGAYSASHGLNKPADVGASSVPRNVQSKGNQRPKLETRVLFSDAEAVACEVRQVGNHQEVVIVQ